MDEDVVETPISSSESQDYMERSWFGQEAIPVEDEDIESPDYPHLSESDRALLATVDLSPTNFAIKFMPTIYQECRTSEHFSSHTALARFANFADTMTNLIQRCYHKTEQAGEGNFTILPTPPDYAGDALDIIVDLFIKTDVDRFFNNYTVDKSVTRPAKGYNTLYSPWIIEGLLLVLLKPTGKEIESLRTKLNDTLANKLYNLTEAKYARKFPPKRDQKLEKKEIVQNILREFLFKGGKNLSNVKAATRRTTYHYHSLDMDAILSLKTKLVTSQPSRPSMDTADRLDKLVGLLTILEESRERLGSRKQVDFAPVLQRLFYLSRPLLRRLFEARAFIQDRKGPAKNKRVHNQVGMKRKFEDFQNLSSTSGSNSQCSQLEDDYPSDEFGASIMLPQARNDLLDNEWAFPTIFEAVMPDTTATKRYFLFPRAHICGISDVGIDGDTVNIFGFAQVPKESPLAKLRNLNPYCEVPKFTPHCKLDDGAIGLFKFARTVKLINKIHKVEVMQGGVPGYEGYGGFVVHFIPNVVKNVSRDEIMYFF